MSRLRSFAALVSLCMLVQASFALAESDLPERIVLAPDRSHRIDVQALKPGAQVQSLVPTPWQIEGGGANVKYGWSATTVGDVNADGYSDVIVTSDGSTSGTGAARLYLGGAGGLATSPVWSRTNFTLGPKAAPAGDVNGDSYGDFIVGWSDFFGTGAGSFNVYYGSFSGVPTGPFTRSGSVGSIGFSFNTAGDVNGDGYDDVVVGNPNVSCNGTASGTMEIYYGGASGLIQSNSVAYCPAVSNGAHFGYSVSTAGDINADGYDDVIAGAPDYHIGASPPGPLEGYVAVYLGGPSGLGGTFQVPPIRMSAVQVGCRYGFAVAGVGDFNGDGYADVAASAPNFGSSGVIEHGNVIIYSGGPSPSGSLTALWGGYDWSFYAHFGSALAPAGDVNGDGYADVAMSSPDIDNAFTDQGAVYVLYGRNGAPTAIQQFNGTMNGEHFGQSLGTAGDVDGDGFSDLIVGAFGFSNPEFQEGRAVLYRGTADAPQLSPQATMAGTQSFENVGWSVAGAGDVNGDGYDDAIVGAWLWDSPTFAWDVGRATVHLGGPAGLSATPSSSLEGTVIGAALGFNVAAAGDVNGDGYGDVIVGQPYNGLDAAKIYPGGPSGVSTTPIWTGTGATGSGYGTTVAGAGDVNGDGLSDVLVGAPLDDSFGTDSGRAYLYLGATGGMSTTPTRYFDGSQPGEHLGESVAGAGDLDGDGYSDIALGGPYYDAPSHGGPITDAGHILVYHGNTVNVEATPRTDLRGSSAMRFGSRVAGIGDANGDGYSDLAVSGPAYSATLTNQGRVLVYPGSPIGLNGGAPIWDIVGDDAEGQYGLSLAGAGDVNGDGRSDLLVGSFVYGVSDHGRASVYATVGSSTPFWTKWGDNAGDWFGFSAAGAGDVNGDGFADVIVGAAAMEAGGQDAGKAFVYLGNLTNGDDGIDRAFRLSSTSDLGPVAPRGSSRSTGKVRLTTIGRTAAGPSTLTMQYRLEPVGAGGVVTGSFGPVNTTTGPDGATAALGGSVQGLLSGKGYEVRARVRSNSPFFPGTSWMSPVMDGREVMDFRTASAATGAPIVSNDRALDLASPMPNPMRGATSLEFRLPEAAHATLTILDIAGREITTLADGVFTAGSHRVGWSGTDAEGHATAAGVYFAKLVTPSGERVQRLVRLR
ncbi:MAG: hypothetical protein HOP12_09515 [Candidatus Eisenbacteria bacterium]|uniref:FlgD/Vpr Ig-like domain-containing protein n=1 Tax=Eiseniibacteriota bacterium TaxID=2212470 RepID=A0A849SP36_UNCEI|nr:hypothetical protein [Candidatus Eisenbacteria bacterium]